MKTKYTWVLSIMKVYEVHYYQECRSGRLKRNGEGYLKWLAEGRYKHKNPRNRRRLLLLCT